jgi:hypothetical protein
MRRFVPLAVLLAAGILAVAQPVPPTPAAGEIRALVEKLGSDEFADREAAGRQLEELGAAAVAELRAGCKSENPEVARRAQDILRRVERRLANEKTLAPTLVELDAKDQPLDKVLAELSKQAKCEVVLGGLKQEELAARKVTVSTGGKVPFWTAVLAVCDAGDVQVAVAGGFLAPGAMPYLGRAPRGVRVAADTGRAVVLEARGDAKKRPAAVYGSVLVEALPFPKGLEPPEPSVLLQAWPEPRLQWQTANGVKVSTATDATGAKLTSEPGAVGAPLAALKGEGGTIWLKRNPDGTAGTLVVSEFEVAGAFRPNVRQAVVRFKPGEKPAGAVKELGVTLFATVRSGVEPLSQAGGLEANKLVTGSGVPVVEMTANYRKGENGRWVAVVNLTYDQTVQAATLSDELAGVKGGATPGNQTVYGVRVTDANGRPFTLGLAGMHSGFEASGKRVILQPTLELYPDRDGQGPPTTITFWGTYAKPVEVPVMLKDVLLTKSK